MFAAFIVDIYATERLTCPKCIPRPCSVQPTSRKTSQEQNTVCKLVPGYADIVAGFAPYMSDRQFSMRVYKSVALI